LNEQALTTVFGSEKSRRRMLGEANLGAPKGNRNAFKHCRYIAEAIAN
jgi:hypothetical protein